MSRSLFKIVWLKAGVSFAIPFFTALGIAVQPYVGKDSAQPTFCGWLVLIITPLVAGLSALSSFLSTTFAEHKAQQAQDAVNDTAGLPAGLPVVVPPPKVSPTPPTDQTPPRTS